MQGNVRECKEMLENAKICKKMQENIQGNTGKNMLASSLNLTLKHFFPVEMNKVSG
jgi:hypothetical protein